MKKYTFNIEGIGVKNVRAESLVKAYNKLEERLESNLVNYTILETGINNYKYKYTITDVDTDIGCNYDVDYKLFYQTEFHSDEKLTKEELISLVLDTIDVEHDLPDWKELEFNIDDIEYEVEEL